MRTLVIVPAYNEADNIERVVTRLIATCPDCDYVVINDGSKDDTAKICRENGFNMIDLPINLGLAGAFQTGMKYAYYHGYDYAIQYDGDGQHNPEYIVGMLKMAEDEKLDIVIGSRYATEKKPCSLRNFGMTVIEICILLTTFHRIKDTTSGMRLYNRKMMERLAVQMNFGPEPDTIAFLIRCGAKVGEYQVHMNERIAGKSYLDATTSMKYMGRMVSSIMLVQWFRRRVK